MRRTVPVLKIPILQINRQPGELVLVATASTALMHASVISEVVMQIRMEKFPGIKLGVASERERHKRISPCSPVNYYNDTSYTISVHNTLPE